MSGSPPPPNVTVKGDPLVAVTMVPSSPPPTIKEAIPDLGPGTSQMAVPTKVWRTSKSHAPILYCLLSRSGTAIELTYVSPVTGAELVSRHLPNVYDN